ncbi:MAG: agmatine deiminase family protein [Bryobacteraceae bacterium]
MPAEWEPHAATWLAWPHEKTDWPGKFAPIAWVYGEIVRHLSRTERVRILVPDRDTEERARRVLAKSGADAAAVEFIHHRTNRSWTRDYGPLFVKNRTGEVAVTNWRFNGWAKYGNWREDDAASDVLAKQLKLRQWKPGVVLEGGSIDVNGRGLLLTTEECLLSNVQARNPELERPELERMLRDYLGVREVIWLKNGIAGDDTHGHVDDVARFVSPGTVVIAAESRPGEANYAPLRENLAILRARRDLRVVKLPMPEPVYFDGQRLPASYANFYIANRLVLMPTFNDAHDRVALNTLARVFPDREVVGIHSVDLVLGLGTLHCMTQQQPA